MESAITRSFEAALDPASGGARHVPLLRGYCDPADGRGEPPDLLLWEGWDERVRVVARTLAATGLARPAMFAEHVPERGWKAIAREDVVRAVGPEQHTPGTHAELAAASLAAGMADAAIGGIDTPSPDVLRAGLRYVGATRTVSIAYFVTCSAGERAGDLLLMADVGVVPQPDGDQLLDIAMSAVSAWRQAVASPPKVAFLDISTKSRNGRTAVVGAVVDRLATGCTGLLADGELQADAAVSSAVAQRKDPHGRLGGSANILIFPSLESSNIALKLLQRLGGAVVFGITQGYRLPFHDISRGAEAQELLDTAIYCAATAGVRAGVGA